MKIKAKYPSGSIKKFEGGWLGFVKVCREIDHKRAVTSHEMRCCGVKLRKNTIAWIDPRAICFEDSTGKVLYNPKKFINKMADKNKNWMIEHPNWPHIEDINS